MYYSVANVLSDLHSGRYNDDPAFNGMKFQSLIPVFKGDDTYYLEVTPAVDVDGTMWAFYDYAKREDNNVIDPENQVGRKLEIVNKGNQFDMSLFHKFKGKANQGLLCS